jgi:putative transposase
MLEAHREFIMDEIRRTPHLTLRLLQDMLAAQGVRVSHDTIWRFLCCEGLSFKKKPARC